LSTDVINSTAFSPFISGLVTIDHENIIKVCSLSPTTLGKGHELVEPGGPVILQSLATSDYHPQLAIGSADGTCTTANMLGSTRRSAGAVSVIIYFN
jgi:transcription factor C subunit 6